MEPTSTSALSYALSKVPYGLAALFMGMGFIFFRKEQTIRTHGKLASAAIIGGACTGSAVIFGGALAVYFGMDPNDVNTATAIGGGIGLIAVSLLIALANYFDKNEDKDILELVQDVKAAVANPADKLVAKPAAKKVVRKVRAGTK
jgi:hypothetical protein